MLIEAKNKENQGQEEMYKNYKFSTLNKEQKKACQKKIWNNLTSKFWNYWDQRSEKN